MVVGKGVKELTEPVLLSIFALRTFVEQSLCGVNVTSRNFENRLEDLQKDLSEKAAPADSLEGLVIAHGRRFFHMTCDVAMTADSLGLLGKLFDLDQSVFLPLLSLPKVGFVVTTNSTAQALEVKSSSDAAPIRFLLPKTRLADDVGAFVMTAILPPGSGNTASHRHLGTEFVYVEEGSLHLVLGPQRLAIRVSQGEYVHFDSSIQHYLENDGTTDATAVIVRLPSRLTLSAGRDLSAVATKENENSIPQLSTDPPPTILRCEAPLVDTAGFATFCATAAKHHGVTLNQLQERVTGLESKRSVSWFSNFHNGKMKSGMRLQECRELAQNAYRIEPFLVNDFFIPSFPMAVTLAKECWMPCSADQSGYKYQYPVRRLLHSQSAVSLLTLNPEEKCSENQHPGSEILICLTGELDVQIGELSTKLSSTSRSIAHFSSDRPHRVENKGQSTMTAIVIRNYGGLM